MTVTDACRYIAEFRFSRLAYYDIGSSHYILKSSTTYLSSHDQSLRQRYVIFLNAGKGIVIFIASTQPCGVFQEALYHRLLSFKDKSTSW